MRRLAQLAKVSWIAAVGLLALLLGWAGLHGGGLVAAPPPDPWPAPSLLLGALLGLASLLSAISHVVGALRHAARRRTARGLLAFPEGTGFFLLGTAFSGAAGDTRILRVEADGRMTCHTVGVGAITREGSVHLSAAELQQLEARLRDLSTPAEDLSAPAEDLSAPAETPAVQADAPSPSEPPVPPWPTLDAPVIRLRWRPSGSSADGTTHEHAGPAAEALLWELVDRVLGDAAASA